MTFMVEVCIDLFAGFQFDDGGGGGDAFFLQVLGGLFSGEVRVEEQMEQTRCLMRRRHSHVRSEDVRR